MPIKVRIAQTLFTVIVVALQPNRTEYILNLKKKIYTLYFSCQLCNQDKSFTTH